MDLLKAKACAFVCRTFKQNNDTVEGHRMRELLSTDSASFSALFAVGRVMDHENYIRTALHGINVPLSEIWVSNC